MCHLIALLFILGCVTSKFIQFNFAVAKSTSTDGYPNSMDSSYQNQPKLCSDGYTYGYSDWTTLRSAVMEVNEGSSSDIRKI